MRIPLIGGSYVGRSIIGSAQRNVNLYPEPNPKDSPFPFVLLQTPGTIPLSSTGGPGPVQELYAASTGQGFAVVNRGVYSVGLPPTWKLTQIGSLVNTGVAPSPVRCADNGRTMLILDGTPNGYTIDLPSLTFAMVNDPAFLGGHRPDFIDTFLLWDILNTGAFQSSHSNVLFPLDGTFQASKTDYPDPLAALIVNRHEIMLIGTKTSEQWFTSGATFFPFAEVPGAYIDHGTPAPYSVAATNISTFWLAQNRQGQGYVIRVRGYQAERISNFALEEALRKIAKQTTLSDAIGFTYSQGGHWFYQLTLPSGDQTWVFDETMGSPTEAWHQRAWYDAAGVEHRDRANCHAFMYGANVVGDWQFGQLSALDLDTFTDTVNGVTSPKQYLRRFPHLGKLHSPSGAPMDSEGHQLKLSKFTLDAECGLAPNGDPFGSPLIRLRWSKDRGRSFNAGEQLQSAGELGAYETWPTFQALGRGRDVVFEISFAFGGQCSIQGAWVDGEVLGN